MSFEDVVAERLRAEADRAPRVIAFRAAAAPDKAVSRVRVRGWALVGTAALASGAALTAAFALGGQFGSSPAATGNAPTASVASSAGTSDQTFTADRLENAAGQLLQAGRDGVVPFAEVVEANATLTGLVVTVDRSTFEKYGPDSLATRYGNTVGIPVTVIFGQGPSNGLPVRP